MKPIKLLTASFAFSLTLLSGCQQELDNVAKPSAAKQSTHLSSTTQQRISQLRASLPAGIEDKLKQRSALLFRTDPQYREMVLKVLAIEADPTCNAETASSVWLDQQLADWNAEVIGYVLDFAMLDLPTYDAYVFENSSENQYFGVNGEYTQRLTKTFKDLRRFWNIQSNDMVLAAMHGNMLLNRDKVIRTYEAVYGLDSATAATLADIVAELADEIPQYRDGNHPLFTFNAFALEGFDFGPYGTIPDKIIMGDGIMDAFTGIGFGDVAPQAILAHEFGHQIQFDLNLFLPGPSTPEGTRRTELMADAYAAYYLSHARGASMQWKRVEQFLQVFFNIGDCSFQSTGHHGTPTQRLAAARWAYNLANNAQKQGRILTAEQFTALFEKELPNLIKR